MRSDLRNRVNSTFQVYGSCARRGLGSVALLAVFFLSSTGTAFAQASKKPGKPSNEKASPPVFLAAPAEEGVLTDKLLWKGYDLFSIANAAMALREPKGEFESTDDYDAKRSRLAILPVYGKVSLQSRLALVVPELIKYSNLALTGGVHMGYVFDADAKKLRLCWSGKEVVSGQLGHVVESIVSSDTNVTEGVAQNAYGAKVNKTSIRGNLVTVGISVKSSRCPFEMDMDGAAAQQSIRTSGAVVFGYLRSPFVEPDTQSSTATFSSPTEVYLKVRRLLFVPEQVILLDRDTRNVIVNWDLPKP